MPRGKRKGKESRRERVEARDACSSDDDSPNDNYSETSAQSDLKSIQDEADSEDVSVKFEDKVMEAVEGLNAKAHASRTACLVALRDALSRRYVAHVLAPHHATLVDHVARALRKGKLGERRAAAALAPLLALQVGEDSAEEFMREVRPALVAVATDRGAEVEARTECCSAVAVLCYLLEDDVSEVLALLATFESIFSGSYLKGDGSVKVSGAAVAAGALHAAALDGWALLLPLISVEHARSMLTLGARPPELKQLAEMLEACSLEVRMATGNALAVAHEHISEDCEECEDMVRGVLPVLADLAKDSNKFRAKRDRKVQRATFRDILKYLEEDELVEETVHLGSETLVLGSWAERGTYAALASALGAGLHMCAQHSPALRAALRLPDTPPAPLEPVDQRMNKLQRQLQNAAAFKARTISRGKNRDKRSAVNAM